jgi:uncharacterized protein with HEPN domain
MPLPKDHHRRRVELFADAVENSLIAIKIMKKISFEQFTSDFILANAVAKLVQNVGEAVAQLQEDFKKKHPDKDFAAHHPGQPWQQIKGISIKIRHGYDTVNYSTVYDVVKVDLPSLVTHVKANFPEASESIAERESKVSKMAFGRIES